LIGNAYAFWKTNPTPFGRQNTGILQLEIPVFYTSKYLYLMSPGMVRPRQGPLRERISMMPVAFSLLLRGRRYCTIRAYLLEGEEMDKYNAGLFQTFIKTMRRNYKTLP
jgi:hypothetical protein